MCVFLCVSAEDGCDKKTKCWLHGHDMTENKVTDCAYKDHECMPSCTNKSIKKCQIILHLKLRGMWSERLLRSPATGTER